ncbi:P-loop containing nucleoside triphosphate hydrolase protein [Spinellus fusiger]|nr:P-loop containing nucleoside triphosphate hydrolase protein [Spinellus fusiger]
MAQPTTETLPVRGSVGRVAAATTLPGSRSTHTTPTTTTVTQKTFGQLGIDDWLGNTLKSMQIRSPTEIQRACIPPILAGKDVIGGAKTGSGKTAAFALPILQKLSEDPYGVFALVLTPTRELAFQIAEQFRVLGKNIGLKECVIVGGLDMMKQSLELAKRPHIIIATPGRLRDHIRSSSGAVQLSRAKFLVMDEADRLLSPTFMSDLSVILPCLPKERQTLLFTATMTGSILALQDKEKEESKKPFVHVCTMDVSTVSTLEQLYIFVPSQVKPVYLAHILRSEEFQDKSVILFCGRCATAELVTVMLKELGIRCTALHSDMTQQQRLDSLGKFKAEVIKVLVSTDVGSRGLDIPSVELVLNYDIPRDPTDYIHRVGRTARAGRGGKALSIVSEKDVQLIESIEQRTNKKMEEYKIDENEIIDELNEVTAAKRTANMQLHDSKFAEKRHARKKKKLAHNSTP